MNPREAMHAAGILGSSPAATWIGNRASDDGTKLFQVCTRCGAQEVLELPAAAVATFRGGARGDAIARLVPPGFDEELFAWKRTFQLRHEGCTDEDEAA